MALYAYNKTGAPLALAAGHPIVTLPASPVPPSPGKPYNVTSELKPNLTVDPIHGKAGGLTAGEYALLQAQVGAGSVVYEWTSDPEYSTASLVVGGPTPGVHAIDGPDHSGTPVAALAGTDGIPGAGNKYVTDSDPRNSNARTPVLHAPSHVTGADQLADAIGGGVPVHGLMSTADKLKLDAHDNANDPTAAEKIALQGTYGVPSVTNRYRSEQDPAVALRTTADKQYYVDFTGGNDANDGLAAVAGPPGVGPKKTLQAIVDIIPYFVDHNVTVNMVGTSLDAGNIWIEKCVAKNKVLLFDGGQGNRTVVADNGGLNWTADIASSSSLGYTLAGWVPNQYKGYMVQILTSPVVAPPDMTLQERLIHSHTATTLVPVRNYSVSPGLNTTFRIVRPTTTISANVIVTIRNEGVGIMQMQNVYTSSTTKINQYGGNGTIFLSHMVVASTATGTPPGVGSASEPINGTGGWLYLDKSSYNPLTWALKSANTDPQSGVGQVAGAGWIYSKGSGLGMQLSGCVLKMVRVARTNSFHVYQGCNVESFGGIGGNYDTGTPVTILNSSGFATTTFGGHATKPSFLLMSTRAGISSGVVIAPSLSPSYPHGIESVSSDLRLYGVAGSGHAGLGVYAHCGGSIQLTPGNLATLTGALGDFGFDQVLATLQPSVAVPGSGLDTVLEARLRGALGNGVTLTTVAGGALSLTNVGTAFTLTYVSGVTTVAQVEALINALSPLAVGSYIRVKTSGLGVPAYLKPSVAVPGSGLDTVIAAKAAGIGGQAITLASVDDAPNEAPRASLDLSVPGTLLNTVIEAVARGTSGNSITFASAADGGGADSITRVGTAFTLHYTSGATTVAQVEALIAALVGGDKLIQVKTTGTGTNVLSDPGDTFLATALAGGANEIITWCGAAFTLHYLSGVTTVANVEALIAALPPSSLIQVKTPGTGATVLTAPGDTFGPVNFAGAGVLVAPGDTFGPVNFTGGLNVVAAGSWSQLFADYMFTSVFENVVAKQVPVTGI